MIIVFVIAILIILIVIYVFRAKNRNVVSSPNDDLAIIEKVGNEGKIQIRQRFIVTIGDKTLENKFFKEGSSKAFFIDNIEAPTLLLQRNVFYEFQNLSDEPLYFTTDTEGGYKENKDGTLEEAPGSLSKDASGSFKGLAGGSIFFMITDDFPAYFYYQSGKHKSMGSIVQVV